MGQDSRCGICGKQYQNCKHYLKTHVLTQGVGAFSYCGKQTNKLITTTLDAYDFDDVDPEDYCRRCVQKIGRPPGTGEELECICDHPLEG